MKVRTLLVGTAGTVLATAAANKAVATRVTELSPPVDGLSDVYRWRGMNVEYTTLGDPDDPDLLLVHGIYPVASGYEFAHVAEHLAADYHVVIVDLPGFGRSDRPPLYYTGSLYAAFVADFADEVTSNPICMATSLSAAYAVEAADRGVVDRLVLICPRAQMRTGVSETIQTVLRSPVIGTALVNGVTSEPSIRWYLSRMALTDSDRLEVADIEYLWQSGHQPGAKYPIAAYYAGALDRSIDLGTALERLDVDITLCWGRDAATVPLESGRELADRADAGLVVFDDARLLPHVEHPDRFADALGDYLDT